MDSRGEKGANYDYMYGKLVFEKCVYRKQLHNIITEKFLCSRGLDNGQARAPASGMALF